MKQKYKLLLSYDGTDFCGWQKQKQHAHAPNLPSIQETLEKALSQLFDQSIDVMGSGRTDAGVHALGQVCHFEVDGGRPPPKDLAWALKSLLPSSVAIKKAWTAPEEFHATMSAIRKTYRYYIWNQKRPTALLHRYSWWQRGDLDLNELNQMAQILIGEKDFKSFQSVGTPVLHTIRKIESAKWVRRPSGLIYFEVTGSGFLKQMVRNIVGTQIDLAEDNRKISKLQDIIDIKDRTKAGRAAPPQGLFLLRVEYPKSLDNKCRQL